MNHTDPTPYALLDVRFVRAGHQLVTPATADEMERYRPHPYRNVQELGDGFSRANHSVVFNARIVHDDPTHGTHVAVEATTPWSADTSTWLRRYACDPSGNWPSVLVVAPI